MPFNGLRSYRIFPHCIKADIFLTAIPPYLVKLIPIDFAYLHQSLYSPKGIDVDKAFLDTFGFTRLHCTILDNITIYFKKFFSS